MGNGRQELHLRMLVGVEQRATPRQPVALIRIVEAIGSTKNLIRWLGNTAKCFEARCQTVGLKLSGTITPNQSNDRF